MSPTIVDSGQSDETPLTRPRSHTSRRKVMTVVGISVTGAILVGVALAALTTDPGPRGVASIPPATFAAEPLLGFRYWFRVVEIATMVMFGATLTVLLTNCIQLRRVTTGTIFFAAAIVLYVLDPIGNWAPYAVYDPRMLHFPVSWPWAAIAPNIEPVVGLFGYFGFYVGIPVLCVQIVSGWLLPRSRERGFVRRRPLLTLTAVTVIVGFVFDAAFELFLVHTGMVSYLQVVPFGSVWVGTPYQFPLLWQSLATTIPFIVIALLWWRGDDGVSHAERLAARWRALKRWGRGGTFILVTVAMLAGYLAFVAPYAVMRKAGWATGTAQPYLFCDMAVPDPNGLMKLNGQPGPYVAGFWPGPYHNEPTRQDPPPMTACPSASPSEP